MQIGSIEKCLRLIELLSQHPKGLKLSDIGTHLNIPSSSVHHMLATLIPHDYVIQDVETKKYSLGFRFLEIGKRILDHLDIRGLARRHLWRLNEACGEAVHLAILRNKKVIYIDKIGVPAGLSLATYVGFATDPHAAAGGKVLLSDLSESELAAIYPEGGSLRVYGKNTVTDTTRLKAELAKIKAQGWALDDEEYYAGVRCVAAPIRAGNRVVAAISVTGSVFSMTLERIENELKSQVMDTAAKISSELRW